MTRLPLVLAALALLSCESSFFLSGTLDGDCTPPHSIIAIMGGSDTPTLRMSNCQPASSVCCRVSSKATRTSCEYPENCYVAPYQGECATAVDCADTQVCTGGSCQCTDGPPCADPATQVVTCCAAGESCVMGVCGVPGDDSDLGTDDLGIDNGD
jgi:hypothetical protein